MIIKQIVEITDSIKFLLFRMMAEDYTHPLDFTLGALCSYKEVFIFTQCLKELLPFVMNLLHI
jgi:hypothetical protein